MARATVAELVAKCETSEKRARDVADQRDEMRSNNDRLHKQNEEIRKQFDDLKTRLHAAEMENQRLRGYVQRVQEDDTVREELVMTGDPDGERSMVPKRKSTVFFPPHPTTDFADRGTIGYRSFDRDRPKPKHWVNY